jgi:hypothetical protein
MASGRVRAYTQGGIQIEHATTDREGDAMRGARVVKLMCTVVIVVSGATVAVAGDDAAGTVTGSMVVNGQEVSLPYVYAVQLEEGFYDPADPAWRVVFVSEPVDERDLDGPLWDVSMVEVLITETAEFDDEPTLQVYSQSLRMPELASGNVSGGTYPELEMRTTGPDRFAGRVHHDGMQEMFDDTFTYDFTFDAPFSDPNAPIGDLLPAGGGEPGAAYLAWVHAIHSGDLDKLRAIVPPDMAAQLSEPGAEEEIEFMRMMTPTEVTILGGSTDGETAVLDVEGLMDGEKAKGEITLQKIGEQWLPVSSSW